MEYFAPKTPKLTFCPKVILDRDRKIKITYMNISQNGNGIANHQTYLSITVPLCHYGLRNCYKHSNYRYNQIFYLILEGVRVWAKRNVALKIWNTIQLFVFPTSLINQGIKQPTMLYGWKKKLHKKEIAHRPLLIHTL